MAAAPALLPSGTARHVVAVVGGATAGAEMAGRLADHGALVVVFEQNPRPYGKIEDGLPRWHVGLRRKEYETISAKLSRPGVYFVPLTRVGRDLGFDELTRSWGFSAVVLACGAWRDRSFPVDGADAFLGRGLVYQNPFIIWFNHCQEAAYEGPRFEPEDAVLVVGGGLASIDVVKVLQLETTRARLRERGFDVPMVELEVKGIPKALQAHGLAWEDLGLEGATLYYRRRVEDMPLLEEPEGATPERLEKTRAARRRVLEKAMEKYRFRFEALAAPEGLIVEGERLVGLRFRRTRIEGRRVVPTDETFERRGPYVISSIGSVPEPLPGIEMKGELFAFVDPVLGRLADHPSVFSAGNVVTGKGNIVASRKHGALVEEQVERFLGLRDGHDGEETVLEAALSSVSRAADDVARAVAAREPLEEEEQEQLIARVRARQAAVGYTGDYRTWIEKVTPPDLE